MPDSTDLSVSFPSITSHSFPTLVACFLFSIAPLPSVPSPVFLISVLILPAFACVPLQSSVSPVTTSLQTRYLAPSWFIQTQQCIDQWTPTFFWFPPLHSSSISRSHLSTNSQIAAVPCSSTSGWMSLPSIHPAIYIIHYLRMTLQ